MFDRTVEVVELGLVMVKHRGCMSEPSHPKVAVSPPEHVPIKSQSLLHPQSQ